MWHLYESVEFRGYSTAWFSDEVLESEHPWIRPTFKKYTRYGETKQLLYVGKKLNNRTLLRSLRLEPKRMEKKKLDIDDQL